MAIFFSVICVLLPEIADRHRGEHFQFGSAVAEVIRGEQFTAEHFLAKREHGVTECQVEQLEVDYVDDAAAKVESLIHKI